MIRARTVLLLGAVATFCLKPLVWAQTIEGTVALPKTADTIALPQRYQSAAGATKAKDEPPTAVVYLEGNLSAKVNLPRHQAVMTQKDLAFSPALLAVQTGTSVEFPNLDDTYHNVFSYSKTKRFDLGRYREGEKPGVVLFDKPGVVSLHCEIHGNMRGTILVLDTPYFQRTDAQGAFRLAHLPAGHFVLKAWLSEDDVRERPIDLKPGESLHVDFPAK